MEMLQRNLDLDSLVLSGGERCSITIREHPGSKCLDLKLRSQSLGTVGVAEIRKPERGVRTCGQCHGI